MSRFFSQEARRARSRRLDRCAIAGAAAGAAVTILADTGAHAALVKAAKAQPGQHSGTLVVLLTVFVVTFTAVTTAAFIVASWRAARRRRQADLPRPGRLLRRRAPRDVSGDGVYDDSYGAWR